MQIPCCCFGIEKAPAGTMVATPAVLMELHPKSPWRSGLPGHANKGFYGLTIPGHGKNLPLCIVDPQGEAEVCHESHLRLVRTVYRRQFLGKSVFSTQVVDSKILGESTPHQQARCILALMSNAQKGCPKVWEP